MAKLRAEVHDHVELVEGRLRDEINRVHSSVANVESMLEILVNDKKKKNASLFSS